MAHFEAAKIMHQIRFRLELPRPRWGSLHTATLSQKPLAGFQGPILLREREERGEEMI